MAALAIVRPAHIARDDFETPGELWRAYNALYRFTVDAAANHRNALCPRYWERETDGLLQSWRRERVWCHPPHSDPAPWALKAWNSTKLGAITVLLAPAQVDADWWHEVVIPHGAVRFLRGRPAFRLHHLPVDPRSAPQQPFAVIVFKPGTKP